MDFKMIFGLIATVLAVIAFIPYLKDIFGGKTKPHVYSWLVWSIIQGVGVLAMFEGGAGWGALGLGIGSLFCISIFLLSFKYGTKNITKIDTFLLIAALITIVVWLTTEDPLWSVVLVSLIDFIAFVPTYRKTYLAPHGETLSTYIFDVVSNMFAIVAIATYSLTTTLYISSLVISNALMVFILIYRRRK
jgi:hypothetical protein